MKRNEWSVDIALSLSVPLDLEGETQGMGEDGKIWRNKTWKMSKFDESSKLMVPRILVNPKQTKQSKNLPTVS